MDDGGSFEVFVERRDKGGFAFSCSYQNMQEQRNHEELLQNPLWLWILAKPTIQARDEICVFLVQ